MTERPSCRLYRQPRNLECRKRTDENGSVSPAVVHWSHAPEPFLAGRIPEASAILTYEATYHICSLTRTPS